VQQRERGAVSLCSGAEMIVALVNEWRSRCNNNNNRGAVVEGCDCGSGGGDVKTRTKVSRRSWGFNELESNESGCNGAYYIHIYINGMTAALMTRIWAAGCRKLCQGCGLISTRRRRRVVSFALSLSLSLPISSHFLPLHHSPCTRVLYFYFHPDLLLTLVII